MLRINFKDQNDPKDPGQQSDQLTQEIAAGSYSLNIELGCKGVCGNIKSSKALQETCTVTCDALGLVEFVKLIQTKDIDPIFYCEGWRLPRCPPKPTPLLTSICL